MIISKAGILAIKGGGPKMREKIANTMNVSPFSVITWVRENSDNGPLTNKAVLQLLSLETGLAEEHLISEVLVPQS